MKTIIIPIFHSLDARNILRTEVLSNLVKGEGLKVVLIVPESKAIYYKEHFSRNNVVIESITPIQENWWSRFLRLVARMMFNSGSMYWQARIRLANTKNLKHYFYDRLISNLGRLYIFRSLLRISFTFTTRSSFFVTIFKKYAPDLIFLTDIYATENVYLGLEGRRNKISVWGMVRSWDNMTSKGTCLFIPDKVVVHNKELKDQSQIILGVSSKNVVVTGLPHFDYYKNYNSTNREVFLTKLKLPMDCSYLLFAPYLGTYTVGVNEVLQILDKAINDGKLPSRLKILVRMPPSHSLGYNDVWVSNNIRIDYPGQKISNSGKGEWEFTKEDMIHFADSIVHSSVVLNFASSVTIDAAALNRPVINIGFDGYGRKYFPESISDIYIVGHFQSIISSGGTPLVKNHSELIETINKYLNNPNLDYEGRMKIVRDQCGLIDGKSGERLAKFLTHELNRK